MPVLLLLALSSALLPVPANAGRMIWSTVETPSNAFYVIVSPSEITAFTAGQDGRTIYSVDTANSKVYRSDDAGSSWNDLSNYLVTAGATLPAWLIAVAPDNPRFVALVTSSSGSPGQIFVSSDSGQSWSDTHLPASGNIGAIAISPNYGSYDIAVGTRASGAGSILIYKAAGIGGNWSNQGFSGDVLAIKFSPNYRADPSLAVLYSTNTGTFFNAGIHDLNANTTNWTALYNGNPTEVALGGAGSSPTASQVITGDLELTRDYSGQAPAMCRAYISIDSSGGNAGVFRIDGNTVYQLMNAQPNKRISSIAYRGTYTSGKLLVGEVQGDSARAVVLTWTTDAPNTCPATCWYQTEKPPTGAGTSGYGNAQVAWSPDGSRAYCGTSSAPLNNPAAWPLAYINGTPLDESAFNVSRDNGKTWNQLSLIDTQISALSDVAVSYDSSTVYLSSLNNAGHHLDSIWRSSDQLSGKSWERVLCVPSTTNDIILRMNNSGNDQAIFFASRGTDDLRQSQDYGQTWQAQLPGMPVADFSVTSINNTKYIYALGTTSIIRKGNVTSLIPQWSQQVATNLASSHTIFAAPTGVIVVGGDASDNRVAFSPDGGTSFSTTAAFPVAGHIHAIADYRLANAFIIYATTDTAGSDIYAMVPGAVPWNPMGAPNTGFWGLAQNGTLYGAAATSVARTLEPETLGPPAIEWSALNQGLPAGVAFTREPVSLKLSPGVSLWAIDNRSYSYQSNIGRLWTYCDCLSPGVQYTPPAPPPKEVLFGAPLPTEPHPDDLVPVYVNSNSIADITFQWMHRTTAIAYEIWVAKDGDFSQILLKKTITPSNRTSPSWTLTDKKGLEQGKTYYWKVRVVQAVTGEKGTGDWSEMLPFTIAENKSKPPLAEPPTTVTAENRTTSASTPGRVSASDNKTRTFIDNALADSNFWIWTIIAALVVALMIVVITGTMASRRKI
jgi:photosystem II stability/assembly factor-like uncharacterized protein